MGWGAPMGQAEAEGAGARKGAAVPRAGHGVCVIPEAARMDRGGPDGSGADAGKHPQSVHAAAGCLSALERCSMPLNPDPHTPRPPTLFLHWVGDTS